MRVFHYSLLLLSRCCLIPLALPFFFGGVAGVILLLYFFLKGVFFLVYLFGYFVVICNPLFCSVFSSIMMFNDGPSNGAVDRWGFRL